MHTIDEIINGLDCFTTKQHKCAVCPFNPIPGAMWMYGCIAGQTAIAEEAQRILEEAQIVHNTEPKRGRWIKRDAWMPGSELATKYFPFQDCSECGWSYRIKILSEFKFCPNCGADMREGSETDG